MRRIAGFVAVSLALAASACTRGPAQERLCGEGVEAATCVAVAEAVAKKAPDIERSPTVAVVLLEPFPGQMKQPAIFVVAAPWSGWEAAPDAPLGAPAWEVFPDTTGWTVVSWLHTVPEQVRSKVSALVPGFPWSTVPADLAFHAENVGGPAFDIDIDGVRRLTVRCGEGATLRVGEPGLPDLPWTVTIRRTSDHTVLLERELTDLPRWVQQVGDHFEGRWLTTPIEGLGGLGPTCPPEASR